MNLNHSSVSMVLIAVPTKAAKQSINMSSNTAHHWGKATHNKDDEPKHVEWNRS